MRRKLLHLFFSLIVFTYVFSSVGVCLVAHYCGGELETVSLFSKPSSCCGGEEDEAEAGDCCKNDSRHVAFQKDFTFHTFAADCKAPVQQLFVLPAMADHSTELEKPLLLLLSGKAHHPPNRVQHAIVTYSVLRI